MSLAWLVRAEAEETLAPGTHGFASRLMGARREARKPVGAPFRRFGNAALCVWDLGTQNPGAPSALRWRVPARIRLDGEPSQRLHSGYLVSQPLSETAAYDIGDRVRNRATPCCSSEAVLL